MEKLDNSTRGTSGFNYGFPSLALCQFCDSCGPQIVLIAVYNIESDFKPQIFLPRETSCKICFIPLPSHTSSHLTIDDQHYAVLRHSCIYSLTAESPLSKFSTYSDSDGWRLMSHFIVKDVYSRGNVRRMSLVFHSVYERPFDIANIAEKMSVFSQFYRSAALAVFDAEKDAVSEWRLQSSVVKNQHARNFCQITDVTAEELTNRLAALATECHATVPPLKCDVLNTDDYTVDFSPLVMLRRALSVADFEVLITKLVQGDQIVVVAASSSPVHTKQTDALLVALGGLLPSKLVESRLIGDNVSSAAYADSWQYNLVGIVNMSLLPEIVVNEECRTVILAMKTDGCPEIVSSWLRASASPQRSCSLGKRYTALFTGANIYFEENACSAQGASATSLDVSEFVKLIKAEFVLESKLVYSLTRLPDSNFMSPSKNRKGATPPTPKERSVKVEECAQLGPGDLCQHLFWASALSGETRRKLIGTCDKNVPWAENFKELKDKLFLQC